MLVFPYAACWGEVTEGISQATAHHEASKQSCTLSQGALRCTQKRSMYTLLWYVVQYYNKAAGRQPIWLFGSPLQPSYKFSYLHILIRQSLIKLPFLQWSFGAQLPNFIPAIISGYNMVVIFLQELEQWMWILYFNRDCLITCRCIHKRLDTV